VAKNALLEHHQPEFCPSHGNQNIDPSWAIIMGAACFVARDLRKVPEHDIIYTYPGFVKQHLKR
jgi:hypothetical protein